MSTDQLPARSTTRVTEGPELLRSRAASLRSQADQLSELLATTYRRRASELELEAWILEVEAGVPVDQIPSPAA
jgi:hypothetical protein